MPVHESTNETKCYPLNQLHTQDFWESQKRGKIENYEKGTITLNLHLVLADLIMLKSFLVTLLVYQQSQESCQRHT